jgi:hypothetical protein
MYLHPDPAVIWFIQKQVKQACLLYESIILQLAAAQAEKVVKLRGHLEVSILGYSRGQTLQVEQLEEEPCSGKKIPSGDFTGYW